GKHIRGKILELESEGGYAPALLSFLVPKEMIYAVENSKPLAVRARMALDNLGIRHVHLRAGDSRYGWIENAPYDLILTSREVPHPESFLRMLDSQLAEGGALVFP